jgi:hypothetical protein
MQTGTTQMSWFTETVSNVTYVRVLNGIRMSFFAHPIDPLRDA